MMKKRKSLRRFCETCGKRTNFSKTKEFNIIICMACGAKRKKENNIQEKVSPIQTFLFLLFGIFVIILMLPTVITLGDESLIRTTIKIKFDKLDQNEAILTIEGENLQWSRTIFYNSSENATGLSDSWIEDIELILIRTLGNYSEVQYAILECNQMANFSYEWRECVELNNQLDIMIINEMINKTIYESEKANLTAERDKWRRDYELLGLTKDNEISSLTKEKEDLETWNQRWKYIGIAGIIAIGYVLRKYKGWGKRKSQEEQEFPKDTSA